MADAIDARLRVSRVIHAAMIVSVLIYAVVVHVLSSVVGWQPTLSPGQAEPLRLVLHVVAAGMIVAVFVLRSRILSAETLGALARQAGIEAALRQLQTRLFLLLAMAESVAIYGLVLFLVGGLLRDFYVLWTASLLSQLALAPRRELWAEVGRSGRVR